MAKANKYPRDTKNYHEADVSGLEADKVVKKITKWLAQKPKCSVEFFRDGKKFIIRRWKVPYRPVDADGNSLIVPRRTD